MPGTGYVTGGRANGLRNGVGVHPCSILIKTERGRRATDGRTVPFLQTMDYHSVGAAQGAHGAQ